MKNPFITIILILIFTTNMKAQEHGGHHDAHSANEHMHRSSVSDLIQRFESPERDAYQHPEKVLEFLGDIQNKTIMDIGAGSGYFSVRLADHGAKVIAADVDEDFQEYLRKRVLQDELNNIELRLIPYDSPGLEEGEVDMVFIVNTYHHIDHRSDYFTLVRKGIKQDGELIIIDFFKIDDLPVGPPAEHKVAIDEVIAELKVAGFSDFEVNVDLLPYQYIIRAR